MTTPVESARALRRAIAEVYLSEPAPPGAARAAWLMRGLAREPENEAIQEMARDLLAVVALRGRLVERLQICREVGEPGAALVMHGLIGHADASLVGATMSPRWRAVALDILEPSAASRDPLQPKTAERLLAMALGVGDAALR